jgi:hypothetical protein
LTLAFPTVNTAATNSSPGTISGTGTSNNMVQFTGDILDLLAGLTGVGFQDEIVDKDGNQIADLLDATLSAGLNLIQKFNLSSSGLTPDLTVDGAPVASIDIGNKPFSLDGTPVTIANAATQLGSTSFNINLGLTPQATLSNNTAIGANVSVGLQALQFTLGSLGTFGPYVNKNTTVKLGTFPPIYSNTFGVNGFAQQTVQQTVKQT